MLNESYKISFAIYVLLLFLPHIIPIVLLSSVIPNQCTGCLFIFKRFSDDGYEKWHSFLRAHSFYLDLHM